VVVKLIAEVFKSENKTLYLFDTFSGMPETDKNLDLHKQYVLLTLA